MNNEDKQRSRDNAQWLLAILYKMAFPVWERYEGNVPSAELRKLDEHGDWPRGLAEAIMRRISSNEDLQKLLRAHFGWSAQIVSKSHA